eukprot:5606302-Amphidinium_carterae.1
MANKELHTHLLCQFLFQGFGNKSLDTSTPNRVTLYIYHGSLCTSTTGQNCSSDLSIQHGMETSTSEVESEPQTVSDSCCLVALASRASIEVHLLPLRCSRPLTTAPCTPMQLFESVRRLNHDRCADDELRSELMEMRADNEQQSFPWAIFSHRAGSECGPPVIHIESDTPVSGNTPVTPRTITETVCACSLRQSMLELETSTDPRKVEERVSRTEQITRMELDQYRAEMKDYYEDKWRVVENLAESKYACARK